jgi:large subunit ribosomal protein L21e
MPERIGGNRRKTRHKFSKDLREKGKLSLSKYFQEFNEGQKVTLLVEPAYQKGMYHRKFYSKTGLVSGKQGKCYLVDILDGKMKKTVIVHPVHIKKVE